MSKRQGQESLENYLREVQRLASLAFPGKASKDAEIVVINVLIAGLSNRRLAMKLTEMETTTIQQTIQLAIKYNSFQVAEMQRSGELDRHRPKLQTVREVESDSTVRDMERRLAELEKGSKKKGNPTAYRGARQPRCLLNGTGYPPSPGPNRQSPTSLPQSSYHRQLSNVYQEPTDIELMTRPQTNGAWNLFPPQPPLLEGPFQSCNASPREGSYRGQPPPQPPPRNYQPPCAYEYRCPPRRDQEPPPLPLNAGPQPLQTIDGVYIPSPLNETYPSPPLRIGVIASPPNNTATSYPQSFAWKAQKNKRGKRRYQKRQHNKRRCLEQAEAACDDNRNEEINSLERVNLIRERTCEQRLHSESNSSSESEEAAEHDNLASADGDKVCLTVIVNNYEEVQAVLDSGSFYSIVDSSLISKRLLRPADCKLFAINQTQVEVTGKTTVQLRIGEYRSEAECYVSPSVEGILLGASWLKERQACMDFNKRKVRLDGLWFDLESRLSAPLQCARVVAMGTSAKTPKKGETNPAAAASPAPVTVFPTVLECPLEENTRDQPQMKPTPHRVAAVAETSFHSRKAAKRKSYRASWIIERFKKLLLFFFCLWLIICTMSGEDNDRIADWENVESVIMRDALDSGTPLMDEEPLFLMPDDLETIRYSPVSCEEEPATGIASQSAPEAEANAPDQSDSNGYYEPLTSPSEPVTSANAQGLAPLPASSSAPDASVLPSTSSAPDATTPLDPSTVPAADVFPGCSHAPDTDTFPGPSTGQEVVMPFFTLEEMSVDVVVAKPPFQLDSWRFAFASVLHLTLQHLCLKMGAVITAEDVVYLHSFVPQEIRGYQPILLILMTLQAVIATPNFIFILREWARRACKVQAPDVRRFQPNMEAFPAGVGLEWSPGLFGLCTLVVGRFMEQPLPETLDGFLESISDLYALAGQDAWVIQAVVEILYFLKAHSWTLALIPLW